MDTCDFSHDLHQAFYVSDSSFDNLPSTPHCHAMISPEVMKELLSVRQVLHYLPATSSTDKGWTAEESQLFWMALMQYPQGPWTVIAEFIGTKSTRQAMTHGQKLRQKLKRWNKRLRRNPAVGSLIDDVSVSPDGRISLGSSPLSRYPVPMNAATQFTAPSVKIEQSPHVKQEELRVGSAATTVDDDTPYDSQAIYGSVSTTGTGAPSHIQLLVSPDTLRFVSAGIGPPHPYLSGPRPQVAVEDTLVPILSYATSQPLVVNQAFNEYAPVLWG